MTEMEVFSTDAILRELLAAAVSDAKAAEGSILIVTRDRQHLRFVISHSPVAAQLEGTEQDTDQGITGLSFSMQQPMIVNDVKADPSHYSGVDELTQTTTKSEMVMPLASPEDEFGVMTAINSNSPGGFSTHDLEVYGAAAEKITERLAGLKGREAAPDA